MSDFVWNQKIKAHKHDPERGPVIDQFTIKDILNEPNRFQVEAIIQSLTRTVSELVRLEEERFNRIAGLMRSTEVSDEHRA